MSEYRIDVKVRNNIILRKIEKLGYKTLAEFCTKNKIKSYPTLVDIVNMTASPLLTTGSFRECVLQMADVFECSPENLFTPDQLNTVLKTNKRTLQVNEAEMRFTLEQQNNVKSLEKIEYESQRDESIEKALKLLNLRERETIERRMGLADYEEHTLAEIGELWGISSNRVRQIEAKALRKMRFHSHKKMTDLKEFTIENS